MVWQLLHEGEGLAGRGAAAGTFPGQASVNLEEEFQSGSSLLALRVAVTERAYHKDLERWDLRAKGEQKTPPVDSSEAARRLFVEESAGP
jgi:hypothetical protein